MSKIMIGADIGGSHISCMAIDPLNHSIQKELTVRKEVDCHAGAEVILTAWSSALKLLVQQIGMKNLGGIGFAMPGPFDYPSGIAWFKGVKKYDNLHGINIREELQRRLDLVSSIPVRFLNDATCFAIGEAWLGNAAGISRVLAITLGTGFGSAFLNEGIPVITGEDVPLEGCLYHIPYVKSIANDYFSTSWFLNRYKELTGNEVAGVKEIVEDLFIDKETRRQKPASRNHNTETSIFHEFGNNLGNFLAPWSHKFQAGCIVIGGNIANSFDYFEKPFLKALHSNQCKVPVFVSELSELAAIAGAARLCDDDFYGKLL
jgi:glucokinase